MSTGPLKPLNQLAQRFDKSAQQAWLELASDKDQLCCMRKLMQATHQLGNEESQLSADMLSQRWEYKLGDYTMRLVFQAMTDPEKTSAGFQFKILKGEAGFETVMLNGFDSRVYNMPDGQLRDVTSHVSMANGLEGIKPLQDALDKLIKTSAAAGLQPR